jgi:ABC-type phosphate transport system substrate-binding protein
LNRLKKALLAALAAAAVAAPMMPANANPAVSNSNDFPDPVLSAGSDTTYFLMNDLALAFNEAEGCVINSVTYPHNVADPATGTCRPAAQQPANVLTTENYDHEYAYNLFPQGSSAGRRELCKQAAPRPAGVRFINFARSSAGPAEGFNCPEAGLTLRFVAFAKDALDWVYYPGQSPAPTTNLTQSQLNDIFVDCTITNWNQLGGENQPIVVWTAQSQAGTRDVWDSFVGGESDNCIPAQYKDNDFTNGERAIREHDANPVKNDTTSGAPNEKYSIFGSFSTGIHGAYPDKAADSVLGSVNGFDPTVTNIQSGDFPFSRFLYNVIRQAGPAPTLSPGAASLVGPGGWICRGEGGHSKPVGDPGEGVASSAASVNYNAQIEGIYTENGMILIRNSGNRCNFTDVVNP